MVSNHDLSLQRRASRPLDLTPANYFMAEYMLRYLQLSSAIIEWLARRDLNPDILIQSQVSYR